MSQLINSTTLGNLIIVTGSVLLLLVLIKIYAWDSITGIFEQREEKIANDIDQAEASREKAEELLVQREAELAASKNEASEIVDAAKVTAKAQEAKIVAEANDEASRLKEKARQDIAQDRAEALADVKGEVADLTVLIAEKVMTANLDAKAQSELIDSYLDKLGDA